MTIWDRIVSMFSPLMPAPPLVGLLDRRDTALKRNRHQRRPWDHVTGIVLHQTACVLGERPARWDSVVAHIGIMRSGAIVLLHDFDRVVWHANGFNARSIGIEIDGMFPGLVGDRTTAWHGEMMTPTDAQLDAARRMVRWICDEVARRGGRINALLAHRQSSGTRRSDPGEAVWRGVAGQLGDLGLSDGGDGFAIDGGRPVPRQWDETRTAEY